MEKFCNSWSGPIEYAWTALLRTYFEGADWYPWACLTGGQTGPNPYSTHWPELNQVALGATGSARAGLRTNKQKCTWLLECTFLSRISRFCINFDGILWFWKRPNPPLPHKCIGWCTSPLHSKQRRVWGGGWLDSHPCPYSKFQPLIPDPGPIGVQRYFPHYIS